MPPRLRAALCGDAALEQMAAISGTDAGDRERDGDDGGRGDAARTAHDVLSRVCVDPAHGVCPASALGRWTPPEERLVAHERERDGDDDAPEISARPAGSKRTAGGSPRRETSPRARSGARRWCVCSANCGPPRAVATPSCCCASASSGRTSRRCTSRTRRTRSTRDRPSRGSRRRRCSGAVAAAASLDPAPPRAPPEAPGEAEGAAFVKAAMPASATRASLAKGLAHASGLVRHAALCLLLRVLCAIRRRVARLDEAAAAAADERARRRRSKPLRLAARRARGAALAALPEPQALLAEISAHARLSSGRESDVNRIHALNALAEYCDLVGPEGLAEANVDPAKTLPAEPLDLPPAELAAAVGFLAAARGVLPARGGGCPDERDGADERNTTHAAASVSRASLAVAAGARRRRRRRPRGAPRLRRERPRPGRRRGAAGARAGDSARRRGRARGGDPARRRGSCRRARGRLRRVRDAGLRAEGGGRVDREPAKRARARGRRAACAFLAEAAARCGAAAGRGRRRRGGGSARALRRQRRTPVAAGRGGRSRARRMPWTWTWRPRTTPGAGRVADRPVLAAGATGEDLEFSGLPRAPGGVHQGSGERETRPSAEGGGRGVRRRVCFGRAHAADGRRASRGAGARSRSPPPRWGASRRKPRPPDAGRARALRKEKPRKEKRRPPRARRRATSGAGAGAGAMSAQIKGQTTSISAPTPRSSRAYGWRA